MIQLKTTAIQLLTIHLVVFSTVQSYAASNQCVQLFNKNSLPSLRTSNLKPESAINQDFQGFTELNLHLARFNNPNKIGTINYANDITRLKGELPANSDRNLIPLVTLDTAYDTLFLIVH